VFVEQVIECLAEQAGFGLAAGRGELGQALKVALL
jgi:hypothetical protein